jgi:hypothetical protein
MDTFPVAPTIAFIVGCTVLYLIKKQFPKITDVEFFAILGLYAALVFLFSNTIVKAIKELVG